MSAPAKLPGEPQQPGRREQRAGRGGAVPQQQAAAEHDPAGREIGGGGRAIEPVGPVLGGQPDYGAGGPQRCGACPVSPRDAQAPLRVRSRLAMNPRAARSRAARRTCARRALTSARPPAGQVRRPAAPPPRTRPVRGAGRRAGRSRDARARSPRAPRAPSAASATTSKPSASSRARAEARNSAWSSTTSTVGRTRRSSQSPAARAIVASRNPVRPKSRGSHDGTHRGRP